MYKPMFFYDRKFVDAKKKCELWLVKKHKP